MNFLTGSIPDDLHLRWPHLKSLDLYDNQMSGPIPDALGRLGLVKLQLKANNFSGPLPDSLRERLSNRFWLRNCSDVKNWNAPEELQLWGHNKHVICGKATRCFGAHNWAQRGGSPYS